MMQAAQVAEEEGEGRCLIGVVVIPPMRDEAAHEWGTRIYG
jgi:hypothetical protein